MSRPYFNHSVQQLEAEFEKHKASLSMVRALRAELDHRTKPKALQLREKIDAHLKVLSVAVAFSSAAPVVDPKNWTTD